MRPQQGSSTLSAPLGDRHQLLCSTYEVEVGDRAFSVAGPVVWNSLPAAVRHADSLHSFKRRLKSYFFSLCFNDDWQVRFRAWRALNSLLLILLTYSTETRPVSRLVFEIFSFKNYNVMMSWQKRKEMD